jgi:hypothetical protein
MLTVYIWILLSQPYDRMMCSMWISRPPTQAVMASAGCVWTPEQAAQFVWRGVDYQTGEVICERPASELPTLTCDLWPLDHYLIRVYDPGYQDQICYLSILHDGPPTQADIAYGCPPITDTDYILTYSASGSYSVPAAPVPVCPMPQLRADELPSAAALATANDYAVLAYHLRWYYGNSYSLIEWQNQFDGAIYKAGRTVQVPPRLIKGLFAQESQFWPLWTKSIDAPSNEVGLGQLTGEGADLVLRYSPDLFNQYCHLAYHGTTCNIGYDLLTADQRTMVRNVFRRSLIAHGTPRQAAVEASSQIITWAQILKAYYCAAGEIVAPAGVGPSWDYALAAYHAGPECIRGGDICPAGQDYITKVKQ